ncbi:timeless family protein [Abeliophyllum distichum]|uniref:Timeless family protein n=1 Tax=Abeliophyllum distichum TaxID=126358 RepID=A0ABD1URP5_9LAMI
MEGLSSICGGLGIIEEDDDGNTIGYSKGEYCLDNLKDLLRFLRRDDPEKREVFKQVCKWNVVGKDLIPIIEHCQEDRNLVLNAVKVLVFLTMPVEPASNDIPQQIEYLWGLKAAVAFSDAVPVIVSLLETPLENLENESFTEDDWKLVQLVLTFFRNTLAIQDISTQQKVGGSATQFLSLRDRFLQLLFQENVMDLILVFSQHAGGPRGFLRQDNLLLLETFFYVFKGQEPELIVKTYLKGSKVDQGAETSVDDLRYIIEEEREKRKLTRLCNLNCYSQFSGTFTRLTLDGSKALFKGNPCSSSADALLKANKNLRGPSKRTMWDHGELPATNNEILKLLYDFTSQFLTGGYNVLMQSMREDIDKEHQEVENGDVVIFFQVARFVTGFQYHKFLILKPSINVDNEASVPHDGSTLFKGNICGPIAETLNESMFQLVISKWRYAFDGLKVTNEYKFLSAAGSLMKTLICMLDLVLKQSPEDAQELQIARILLYKLFYDQTEEGMTQLLLNLIKSFDTHKQSKSDLANLVETMHVVLRLMENLQARGTLRVSKKSRKRRMKTAMNSKTDIACEPSVDNSTTQNEVGGSICEESVDANVPKREKFTNHDCNGETDTRNPVQVDEPVTSGSKPSNLGSNESDTEGTNRNDANDGLYLGTDDSSGDEQPALIDEVDLKVSSLVSAFANNTIIRNLCWLLKFYKSNSISTNHYIISMLGRICDDLELSPMLYQLSYLTIFYDILDEQKSRPGKEYENVVTFLTTLIRRMLRKMKSHPFLFVEVLFWKTRKECHYINCGSMLEELNSLRNDNGKGRNVAPNGETGFFEGKRWVCRSIADALGDDDFVIPSHNGEADKDPYEAKFQKATTLGEGKELSQSIINKGIDGRENSDGVGNSGEEGPERVSKRRGPLVLDDELERKIKDLHEKYKDSQHCCRLIAGELDPNGAISQIQVSKTLKQLGFKVPPQKKMQGSGASDQLRDNDRNLQKDATQPSFTVLEEGSSLRKPLHSRKRIRAFSEDQEKKIKDLFEQFKDHKRSSYMIASALDSTGTISAAKVSRKLKQLGLVVPKRKRSDTNLHLRDEGYISSEGAGNSDDETLLSLRRRGKHQRNGINYDERQNQKIASKSSEDVPDDELLSSILAKTRKMLPKSFDDSAFRDTQVSEMDDITQSNQMEAEEIDTMMENRSSDAETEVMGTNSEKQSDTMSIEKDDLSQNPHLDELADSDADPDTTQENAPSRRRLRMVIDFEDDE